MTPTEPPTPPLLRKARRVTGKTLVLRDAVIGLVERIGANHRIVQRACQIPGLRWACGV